MTQNILLCALTVAASSLFAADTTPKDEVAAAAKALADKANYSWRTTVAVPEGSRFRPGPTEGKTEKDGITTLKLTFGDNTTEAVLKGSNAVVTSPDGGWQTLAELTNTDGPGRFIGGTLRNFKTPAVQAGDLAGDTKDLKKDGDVIAGELAEERAKTLLAFRPRGGGGDAPTVSDAKGTVKFWTKDGVLSKYEFKVTGKVSFNGNDRDVDRTTTTEIKDIGTTKVEVPEEAKKKLAPEPAPAAK